MRGYVRYVGCAVLLIISACGRQSDSVDLAVSRAELDFDAGDIQGTILWGGQAISAQEAQQQYAFESDALSFWSYSSSYSALNVAPGVHTLGLYNNSCVGDPNNKVGEVTLTVVAGAATPADIDLTATAGRVSGSVAVNGAPLANARIALDTQCGEYAGIWADQAGVFSRILAPRTYNATIYSDTAKLTTLSFTVVAGQALDLGTIDIAVGNVQGTILWGGQAISAQEAQQQYAFESDALSFWSYSGSYNALNVAPGVHTLGLYNNSCVGDPNNKVGEVTLTVVAGTTTPADIDLTATAGRVTGSVAVNGAPLANARIALDTQCGEYAGIWADQAGVFSRILAPRTYNATIYSDTAKLTTLSFTVVAGQALDLGTIDIAVGNVQGTILWGGQAISAQEAQQQYAFESDALSFWSYSGSYNALNVAPGVHTLGLYNNSCVGDPNNKVGEVTLTVVAGTTTPADIDLTATAGRVTGSITVNGAPLANARIALDTQCGEYAGIAADADGHFSRILAGPRTYHADVFSAVSKLGSFTFDVLTRQITDVDVGTTPQCDMDECEPVDLSGGIASVGGITLGFSTVLVGGTTTVVESGSGPPPPTGFRIVGIAGQDPRFWDINTTAQYTGPISVCIHYDEDQIQGNNESSIKLVHYPDDSGQPEDITTSLDTTSNIICGTAYSLSPFAVVEPVIVDTDSDGIADAADQCPATAPAAVVDAAGCSLDQLVLCSGRAGKPWKNHGAYVSAFKAVAQTFVQQGLIDQATADRLVDAASRSRCGR